jgi:hypothetical protein
MIIIIINIIIIIFAVLGMEPRSLYMLGKCHNAQL